MVHLWRTYTMSVLVSWPCLCDVVLVSYLYYNIRTPARIHVNIVIVEPRHYYLRVKTKIYIHVSSLFGLVNSICVRRSLVLCANIVCGHYGTHVVPTAVKCLDQVHSCWYSTTFMFFFWSSLVDCHAQQFMILCVFLLVRDGLLHTVSIVFAQTYKTPSTYTRHTTHI